MNYKFPFYYNDFVIIKLSEDLFGIQSVEDFHTDNKKLLFSSPSVNNCIEYLDGRVDILFLIKKFIPFRRYVKKSYLYLREVKSNIYNNIILKNYKTDKKIIEFSGWAEPFIETRVGTHPVFNFTFSPPEGYCYKQSKHLKYTNFLNIRLLLIYLYAIRISFKFFIKKIPIKFIIKFVSTRRIRQISDLPIGEKNIVLYPTYPFTVEQHSWFIEIEDMLTLMNPFVSNGTFNPDLDRKHPIIRMLEILFESNRFKGVISHLKATADGLKILFKDNPKIPPKIYFIPLGTQIGPQIIRSKVKKNINILFLNGWAQDPKAFYRRGGLDALESFSYIADEFPHIKLIVRSPLPRLEDKYQRILSLKNVEVIDKKLSRESLHNLYENSEILLFPAVRIAVTTLLQAMENSLAIVASDGFGIEEYIEDGVNGLISKGFYRSTGYIDEEGIYREDWLLSLKSNPEVCKSAAENLRRLISSPEYLLKIQEGARKSIEQKYSINAWNKELKKVLDNF
jgi:glycosyltransferase involved in cell wall biosynthesis